ncbi:peptidase dimerization domain-containing protein [Kiritimatiellaeota bacterium B1221]|nr:peptidase dimerization domain-containing protein [Kiritimatiellaeota bacterium B1221]
MINKKETIQELEQRVRACQDILLANLVMMSETPAPTFHEQDRVRFLLDRFREAGLDYISDDEVNNGLGYLPGPEGAPTVALVAHLDTVFSDKDSHALSLGSDRVKGIGIGDNSLGAAVLASLPHLIQLLEIPINVNLWFCGVSRSLGRGNLGGIRFLLDHLEQLPDQAICIEGAPLGRLNYTSLAMMRGEIEVEVPDEYDFSRFGVMGAIVHMNDIINRILEIPRPSRPQTSVVFGSLHSGNSFHELARKASLRFEVRSESDDVVEMIEKRISQIIEEVRARSGVNIALNKIAHRSHGGLDFSHPLVQSSQKVLENLAVEPKIGPSMSELAAFISHDIPAITLGISNGHEINTLDEEMEVDLIFKGITQILGVLQTLNVEGELS